MGHELALECPKEAVASIAHAEGDAVGGEQLLIRRGELTTLRLTKNLESSSPQHKI